MKNQSFETPIENMQAYTFGLKKREANKIIACELYLDICAFMSIIYKMEHDELVDNTSMFVIALNESGFRTVQGQEFSRMGYENFMKRVQTEHHDMLLKMKKEIKSF